MSRVTRSKSKGETLVELKKIGRTEVSVPTMPNLMQSPPAPTTPVTPATIVPNEKIPKRATEKSTAAPSTANVPPLNLPDEEENTDTQNNVDSQDSTTDSTNTSNSEREIPRNVQNPPGNSTQPEHGAIQNDPGVPPSTFQFTNQPTNDGRRPETSYSHNSRQKGKLINKRRSDAFMGNRAPFLHQESSDSSGNFPTAIGKKQKVANPSQPPAANPPNGAMGAFNNFPTYPNPNTGNFQQNPWQQSFAHSHQNNNFWNPPTNNFRSYSAPPGINQNHFQQFEPQPRPQFEASINQFTAGSTSFHNQWPTQNGQYGNYYPPIPSNFYQGQPSFPNMYQGSYRPWLKVPDPPSFSGNNDTISPYEFLKEIEKFQIRVGCSDWELLNNVIPHLLRGYASSWYEGTSQITQFISFAHFSEKFKNQFQTHNHNEQLKKELERRTQARNERLCEYIVKILEYYRRLQWPMNEFEFVSRVISGLNPDYAPYFRSAHMFSSLKDFEKEAERVDSQIARLRSYRSPSPRSKIDPLLQPDNYSYKDRQRQHYYQSSPKFREGYNNKPSTPFHRPEKRVSFGSPASYADSHKQNITPNKVPFSPSKAPQSPARDISNRVKSPFNTPTKRPDNYRSPAKESPGPIKCYRCQGPHRIRDCKVKSPASGNDRSPAHRRQ